QRNVKTQVICGPKDCRDLAEVFDPEHVKTPPSQHDIEIIAEINHAPRLSVASVLAIAKTLRASGADTIDIGCDPGARCHTIGDYVTAITDEGMEVSIDTFDAWEAQEATRHGATLVLSVNSSNREAAKDWGAEVVVIPDQVDDKKSFQKTIEYLAQHQVPMRLDPILEPIGAGLMPSLIRYAETRRDYPEFEMMMGIGNLTELTEVDSAGVNFLLLGICQELGIRSVLTTEVINWARSSVRECAAARKLVHYSVQHRTPPKHLTNELVQLRDPKLKTYPPGMFESLARSLKDNNYRI
ncbi:MAG: dihydropteroate synthase, partial [Novipirellula sp. JB048]